jgi:flagellar basal body-associated protein FliL
VAGVKARVVKVDPAPPHPRNLDSQSHSMPEQTADKGSGSQENSKAKGAGFVTVLLTAVLAGGGAGAGTAWFVAPMRVGGALAGVERLTEGDDAVEVIETADWELYTVDNLILNPAGTRGRRFLVASVAVEVDRVRTLPLLQDSEIQVRDGMIRALSSQGVDELADPTRRTEMEELLRQVVSDLTNGAPVGRVYFSRFVIQ